MKKLISILVAFAMTAMLSITAFAANPVATSTEAGEPIPTKITKEYNKAEGVGNPTVETFNFTAAPQTVEGYKTFAENVTATAADLTVADLFGSTQFTEAGKYRFWVTEDAPTVADGYTSVNGRVGTKETSTADFKTTETTEYSQAKYQVDLVVASYTDPTTLETSYYVQSAAVTRLLDDEGKTDGTKPEAGQDDGDGINLDFTNKVNKEIENITPPGDEPTTKEEDKNALEISKTTALAEGVEAGTTIPDQEFNFKATVTFPDNSKAESYTAVVKELGENNVPTETTQTVTFTPSANAKTFTLKNGQWLAFTDIEAGAKVTVTEDTYPGFTASGLETNYVVKDTGNNAIDVTNKYDPSEGTVTGILMSNIPYIVLALVAIGGLCAYVVIRRKNADEA